MLRRALPPLIPGLLSLLLLGLSWSLPAHADAGAEVEQLLPLSLADLLDVEVAISTNTLQQLSKAPSVVSVITADDIKATGTTNLMEILQSVPGIYIRHNQFAFRPLISMRGSAGTHVLLMVNGAPMRDLVWSSGIFWKGLPASMVERVEIIRGPGSALFGSDASAGVINVITKTAGRITESEAGLRAGSFDSQAGWLRHGTTWNGFDIALTAEVSRTDGHRPFIAADRQALADPAVSHAPDNARYGWDSQDVRLAIGKGHWRLLADFMRHGNLEIGLTGAGVLDPRTRAGDSQASAALLYNNDGFARDWGLNAELRYRDLDYTSGNGFWERPPGYVDPGPPAIRHVDGYLNYMQAAERRLNAEASALYSGFRGHSLRFGAGYVWQDLYLAQEIVNNVPVVFVPEEYRQRTNGYAFVQDAWRFTGNWELTVGARYDKYSRFGGAVTPRAALVWQATERFTAKLMYGEAFRVPSYLELYVNTSATRPNPELPPEKTRTTELAFSYLASGRLKLGFNLFRFMQTAPILDSGGQFRTMDGHAIRGVEMEALWQPAPALRLAGNFTRRWQDFWPNVTYYAVPREEAYLRLDWTFRPKWHWNLQTNWTGRRSQATDDSRVPLGSHALTDTTIRYVHDKTWEFAASIRNLFDVDAREYTGRTAIPDYLPLPGRGCFAEVRLGF